MDRLDDISFIGGLMGIIGVLFILWIILFLFKYLNMWIFGVTDILRELREIKSKLK